MISCYIKFTYLLRFIIIVHSEAGIHQYYYCKITPAQFIIMVAIPLIVVLVRVIVWIHVINGSFETLGACQKYCCKKHLRTFRASRACTSMDRNAKTVIIQYLFARFICSSTTLDRSVLCVGLPFPAACSFLTLLVDNIILRVLEY